MFSESDRRYLRDPDRYAEEYSRQSVRERKQAIQSRARHALLDFTELYEHMDGDGAEKIFEATGEEREELIQALINLFAFLYRETHVTTTIPSFEHYLETGVRKALMDMAGTDFYDVNVDLSIDPISPEIKDWDQLESKLRQGEWDELTDEEARWFLRYYQRSDEFDPGAAREVYDRRVDDFLEWANEGSSNRTESSREKQVRPEPENYTGGDSDSD